MAVQRAWYLLQTKPRQDARALENLENQGFEVFAPMLNVERIRAGKRQTVTEPLFPGYLFIYLDQVADNWRPIRSTRGVSRLVTFNDMPLPVAGDIIERLRQRIADKQPKEALKSGDPVHICQGAFAELDAVFECYDGTERVVILLNLMHRTQRLSMPLANIRRA
ncbi:transcription/translation regulatory transformer protein RfaH [Marinobacterium aestuariivivens]|uniref:Transcription antitermination protein RfaH n=1 Tax=Marinobacterium aestuariivivens TaxID=1698799 RepID=A0ABW1ZX11_9GAMM